MNVSVPLVFDTARQRLNRDRAAAAPLSHRFLSEWSLRQLAERLGLVRRQFSVALQIGCLTGELDIPGIRRLIRLDPARGPLTPGDALQADPDMLPFPDETLDLVLSPFLLHTVNDLPGALNQIRRVLKPDGLFMAAIAGGETLRELRHCLMDAEMSVRGGVSPRVFPFADKPQMGALMQRAGFALPVVDSEIVKVSYPSMFGLMKDLRLMGEGNIVTNRDTAYPGRDLFLKAADLYQDRYAGADGRIDASFEIIFLLGWAPHEGQQKPLRPGQAKIQLADALETQEHGAGDDAAP